MPQKKTSSESATASKQSANMNLEVLQGLVTYGEQVPMNFLGDLADSCTYELDGKTYVRKVNRKLLEALCGTSKVSKKVAIFGSVLTDGQFKTLRERAGYHLDSIALKNESYK